MSKIFLHSLCLLSLCSCKTLRKEKRQHASPSADNGYAQPALSSRKPATFSIEGGLDFMAHQKMFAGVARKIHKRMMRVPRPKASQYNSLRRQLFRISRIYRKRYPNCLPPPLGLLGQQGDVPESSSARRCRTGHSLGYNFALNWMKVFRPVAGAKQKAWIQLEEAYENSKALPSRRKGAAPGRVPGDCFARGLAAAFNGQFESVQARRAVAYMLDPRAQVRSRVAEMRGYLRRIQKRLRGSQGLGAA